ncbi:MAG: undecaprenyl-phosphate glucose phosphotransferase [bacterium]|nr:undecaprenyl-phosphate glucose phosphotransferase [bacterium]
MISRRYRYISLVYVASDVLATILAFFLAWQLRFSTDSLKFASTDIPAFSRYLVLLPVALVLWVIVFYFHGLYQARRGRSGVDEALTVTVAVILGMVLLTVFIVWNKQVVMGPSDTPVVFTYSRVFLALFATLDVALVTAGRLVIRGRLRSLRRKGHNLQRILVVGAGVLGQDVARKLQAHEELGFRVEGFVDDDPAKLGQRFNGAPVVGTLDEIDEQIQELGVDQVYVAMPLEAHTRILEVLRVVGSECVDVKMVPDILQYATLRAQFEDLDGTPVINLSQVPLRGWSSLVKRGMDMAIAAVAVAGLAPFLPLVAAAIWIEDKGPIFYRQERMGLDGKPFWIWKLRSMRANAESSTGPIWAIQDDPRRTRVGSFLRHWSIDELPQLWNVLKGEMSIVGPRPERPAFVKEFKHQIPQYMLRHKVKAGITGWAQVHGWRGNTSIRKRIQYDLYYIENWSLGLDIKILWLTLRHGLRHNAY